VVKNVEKRYLHVRIPRSQVYKNFTKTNQKRFHMVGEKMDRADRSETFGYKFKGPSN